jgi:hypothetical protein
MELRPMQTNITFATLIHVVSCTPTLSAVRIDVGGEPEFMAYRSGEGEWKKPSRIADGAFSIEVTNEFDVVVVCVNPDGSFDAEQLSATLEEGSEWRIGLASTPFGGGCWVDDAPDPSTPTFLVTGTMLDPGNVFMLSAAGSPSAPWSFQLRVPSGPHDLIATTAVPANADGRIVIRRRQMIIQDTQLSDVDVVGEGSRLQPTPLAVTGEAGAVATQVALTTPTDHSMAVIYSADTPTLAVVPSSLIEPDDLQHVLVRSNSVEYRYGDGIRQIHQLGAVEFVGGPIDVSFSAVPEVTHEGRVVRWDSSGTFTMSHLLRAACTPTCTATSPPSVQRIVATPRSIELREKGELWFDVTAPGYQEDWIVNTSDSHYRSLSIAERRSGVDYTTLVSDRVER